jgi:LysM repeat protein
MAVAAVAWTNLSHSALASADLTPSLHEHKHLVQPGETLSSVARRYGVSVAALAASNGVRDPDHIQAGQWLVVPGVGAAPAPTAGTRYVVQLGDTLHSISVRFGVSLQALMRASSIANPNRIWAGQSLIVPGARAPAYQTQPAACGAYYVVKPGDNLTRIAMYHSSSVHAIVYANHLPSADYIRVGQRLHVPCPGAPAAAPVRQPAKPGRPPAQPRLRPAACPSEISIAWPREGEHVRGIINIVGSANITDFQFYKVEYAMGHSPLDIAFHSINDVVRSARVNTSLMTWNTDAYPEGAYTLRLTAVDNRGQFPGFCDAHITIDR